MIISIVVGLIAGFFAEKIMNSSGGLLTNLFVGIVGGMLGGWVAGALGLAYIGDGFVDRLVVSTCGAVLLLAIWRAVTGRRPA
ncbi:GlsB/YeaQ/YmgE family stress response membrane protein [Xanthobacter dioxanivorans]|uniref:GlsB/YeaQ/YmgE family stress response membrane protein n=1 Tax=Xanthobacter dioxanivorans TaxID=2528964 RepID=A0A974PLX4_9HYPH|nr:GlsB/YeaQ/YmgE family stress response membrane protein [Xanthobacter dioxanivorans]QRG05691.1 GlsB/YeaQ/YmgE family stress response membrane protein [Xanthobacter dioxanivorans]